MSNKSKQSIIDIFNNIRGASVKCWMKYFTDVELKHIQEMLTHLNINNNSFREIRTCYINNIYSQPVCSVCGNPCVFDNNNNKYKNFCSIDCKKTKQGKKLINDKVKKTSIEKYGVEHYSKTIEHNDKVKKTSIEKYGVEHYSKTIEYNEKVKKTSIEKYGVENASQSTDIKNKRVNSNIEKYGVDNVFQNDDIKTNIKKNNLKKYGVEYYSQTDEYRIKTKKLRRSQNYDIFVLLLQQKQITQLFNKDDYIEFDYNDILRFKCEKCGMEFTFKNVKNQDIEIISIYCPNHKYKSQAEFDIYNWLISENKNLNIILNKRFYYNNNHFYEIDLYLPELNIGIEYHGLYWHSEARKKKNYHKNKYDFFKNMDVQLIQIFENEWVHKKDIVKSILRTKLGVVERKVYGRSCTIRNIKNDEYKQFCELNHIQGYCNAKVKLGLYDKTGELVQIMSFSKPRFNKNYDWENIRTCTKINTVVVGGFSKLLKYFKNNYPGSIISYVDLRYFNGNGYINNGFEKIGESPPNFFYFKNDSSFILESRQKYQKHKLINIFDNFDSTKTSHENMLMNNYLRIYDAGNLVLISV